MPYPVTATDLAYSISGLLEAVSLEDLNFNDDNNNNNDNQQRGPNQLKKERFWDAYDCLSSFVSTYCLNQI